MKETIKNLRENIYNELNDNAKNFAENYANENCGYISDAMHEYADNNTSIYYAEQRKYYYEHAEDCERALLEFCDPDTIADKVKREGLDNLICYAGMLGEYSAIYNELSNDDENIKKYIALNYLFYNEQVAEKVEDLDALLKIVGDYHIDEFSEILDAINEATEGAKNEQ